MIYSLEERSKLVYLIEARTDTPEQAAGRAAGQRHAGAEAMTDGHEIAIDVHGLSKSFGGRTVVRNLSMQVKRGTIYGFLGPNGSGKTTTIRMLTGLLTPDEGQGTCLGFNIRTEADEIKRHVGYMTQRFSLYQDLSVRENLEFVARLYGLPKPAAAARAMVERLGLKGREEQLAGELSGGWKQRLALGACTLPNPELLLLDEPTAGVDPKARREFWNEIHALAADGLTVLVSTHYMDEAERCHEIAYIAYGVLLVHGTVEEVIASAHLATYTVSTANGEGLAKLAEELAATPGHRHGRALRHQPACGRARRGGARGGDRAVPRAAGPDLDTLARPRSRTSSSTSWARRGTISNERVAHVLSRPCRTQPSPRERWRAVGRVGDVSEANEPGWGASHVRYEDAPHPRPLPTARFASRGRGEAAAGSRMTTANAVRAVSGVAPARC